MDSYSTVGISLAELLSVAFMIIGALWALGKIGMGQYLKRMDEKFSASDKRIDEKFLTVDNKLKTFDPLHGELARVDKDLVQVRLEMATNFVRQEGLRHLTERMETLFKEVFNKLDNKADKAECASHHGDRREQ